MEDLKFFVSQKDSIRLLFNGNAKLKSVFMFLLFFYKLVGAQNVEEMKSYNGIYHLMEAEYSIQSGEKNTTIKNLEIDKLEPVFKSNETILLVTSECEKCKRTVYTYKIKESEQLGKSFFIALQVHTW